MIPGLPLGRILTKYLTASTDSDAILATELRTSVHLVSQHDQLAHHGKSVETCPSAPHARIPAKAGATAPPESIVHIRRPSRPGEPASCMRYTAI